MTDGRGDLEEFKVFCVHSMTYWWCLGCVQGHARRVTAENERLRAALLALGVSAADVAAPLT